MPRPLDQPADSTPEPDLGLSLLDLAELAPNLRRVMQGLMRLGEATEAGLRVSIEQQPEGERLTGAHVDEALKTLLAEHWIIRAGEAESPTYKINFARRRGHVLDPAPAPGRRPPVTMQGIWDKLDDLPKR